MTCCFVNLKKLRNDFNFIRCKLTITISWIKKARACPSIVRPSSAKYFSKWLKSQFALCGYSSRCTQLRSRKAWKEVEEQRQEILKCICSLWEGEELHLREEIMFETITRHSRFWNSKLFEFLSITQTRFFLNIQRFIHYKCNLWTANRKKGNRVSFGYLSRWLKRIR